MIMRRLEVLIVLATVVFCGCETRNEKPRPEPASQGDALTKPAETQPISSTADRARAFARIAELGGRTAPASSTPEDRVLFVGLSGTQVKDADLWLVAALPGLQHLDLSDTRITNDGLKYLVAMKELSSLDLRRTLITGAGLTVLRSVPKWGHLDVTDTTIRESELVNLEGREGISAVVPFPIQAARAWVSMGLAPTEWTTSGDGVLSLRLLATKNQSSLSKNVVLMAEMRNDSSDNWFIMRPLGDVSRAQTEMLSIRGPKGPVRYVGPIPSETLGDDAYTVLRPGQIIRDQIKLTASLFKDMTTSGEYFFLFRYSMTKYDHPRKPESFPEETRTPWTGEISTKELKIVLKPSR